MNYNYSKNEMFIFITLYHNQPSDKKLIGVKQEKNLKALRLYVENVELRLVHAEEEAEIEEALKGM